MDDSGSSNAPRAPGCFSMCPPSWPAVRPSCCCHAKWSKPTAIRRVPDRFPLHRFFRTGPDRSAFASPALPAEADKQSLGLHHGADGVHTLRRLRPSGRGAGDVDNAIARVAVEVVVRLDTSVETG